ncbi:hypothetical protein RRG08_013682 [Elysia crispata]|uniref:Endonuclease/exonuclease/phosphatase domain-containing protein n=1 Tax=Elysia crispata TaxID=231223 RepID=A0AAE1A3S9_9GAST|nr:hypothetical protein RRG08_013682 [Elysia crispata]
MSAAFRNEIRFSLRGYQVFEQHREGKRKGGILTLIRNDIPVVEILLAKDNSTGFLGAEIILPSGNLQIYNVYSPPSDTDVTEDHNSTKPENWMAVGDFNGHCPSWGYQNIDKKGDDIEEWMIEH